MSEYYFDSQAAGGGDGSLISPFNDSPYAHPSLLIPGNTIYEYWDSKWRVTSVQTLNGIAGTADNKLSFVAVGSGSVKPTHTRLIVRTGFTNTSGNIWRLALSAPKRVFKDGVALAWGSSAAVTASAPVFHDGTYLYVYTTTNPNSAAVIETDAGTNAVLRFINCAGISLNGIRTEGGEWGIIAERNDGNLTASNDWEITLCESKKQWKGGHRLRNFSNSGARVEYTSNSIDAEVVDNEYILSNNDLTIFNSGNGVELVYPCSGAHVAYNTVGHCGHVAYYLNGADYISEYNSDIGTGLGSKHPWSTQGSTDANFTTDQSRDSVFRWHYSVGATAQGHTMGLNNRFYGNIVEDMGLGVGVSATAGAAFNVSGISGRIAASNLKVHNNLAINCAGLGYRINTFTGAGPSKNNYLGLNLSIDCGSANNGLQLDMANDANAASNEVSKSDFWSSTTSNVIKYRGVVGTVAAFEAAVTNGDIASGNINYDFQFADSGDTWENYYPDSSNTQGLDQTDTNAYRDRTGSAFNALGPLAEVGGAGGETGKYQILFSDHYIAASASDHPTATTPFSISIPASTDFIVLAITGRRGSAAGISTPLLLEDDNATLAATFTLEPGAFINTDGRVVAGVYRLMAADLPDPGDYAIDLSFTSSMTWLAQVWCLKNMEQQAAEAVATKESSAGTTNLDVETVSPFSFVADIYGHNNRDQVPACGGGQILDVATLIGSSSHSGGSSHREGPSPAGTVTNTWVSSSGLHEHVIAAYKPKLASVSSIILIGTASAIADSDSSFVAGLSFLGDTSLISTFKLEYRLVGAGSYTTAVDGLANGGGGQISYLVTGITPGDYEGQWTVTNADGIIGTNPAPFTVTVFAESPYPSTVLGPLRNNTNSILPAGESAKLSVWFSDDAIAVSGTIADDTVDAVTDEDGKITYISSGYSGPIIWQAIGFDSEIGDYRMGAGSATL